MTCITNIKIAAGFLPHMINEIYNSVELRNFAMKTQSLYMKMLSRSVRMPIHFKNLKTSAPMECKIL